MLYFKVNYVQLFCVISPLLALCVIGGVLQTCANTLTIPILVCLCVSVYVVQRRAIVTVFDAHRQYLDVTSLIPRLKSMDILTAEQCQKLASLDDKESRHEALLYTLLAHDGTDTYHRLVECLGQRDISIATHLQGVLVYQVK